MEHNYEKLLLARIKNEYSKELFFRESYSYDCCVDARRIKSGMLSLDLIIGGDGLPRGEFVEIFGEDDAGKTALGLLFAAQLQSQGGCVAYFDLEGKLEPGFAQKLGVDTAKLIMIDTKPAEDVFELCELFALGGAVELIIVDSLAALLPSDSQDIFAQDLSAVEYGMQVAVILKALRRLYRVLEKTGCTVVFINQLRYNFNKCIGSKDVSSGGISLKLYAKTRLKLYKVDEIEEGNAIVGRIIGVDVIKNMRSFFNSSTILNFNFEVGFSFFDDLVRLCFTQGVLQWSGKHILYNHKVLGACWFEGYQTLQDNPSLVAVLVRDVSQHYEKNERLFKLGKSRK